MSWFTAALTDLPDADPIARAAVRERAATVVRPPGALRRLDELAVHIAGWQASTEPAIRRPHVVVFAGDHGVVAGGVSAYPAEVTAEMLRAVRAGRATINAIAGSVGATLTAHDVGVGVPTADIRTHPALSPERFDEIAQLAAAAVDAAVDDGIDLLVVGELGIGNTTPAAALPVALIGGPSIEWVGRGTGVDDDGLARKRDAVVAAAARVAGVDDPIEVLRQIGGSELVAMAAACARARQLRLPVVLDGYIATSSVLPLHLARPGSLDHCIAGHRSGETGHARLLDHLGLEPVLDLELRLGEGSGALAAVPLVRLACAAVTEVATFEEWFGGGAAMTGPQ